MRWPLLIGTLSLIFVISYALSGNTANEAGILTTTVDPIKKIIVDDSTNSGDENSLLVLVSTFLDNINNILLGNATMLAATANPFVEFIKVVPGMRKEEIALVLQDKLSWSEAEKNKFLNVHEALNTSSAEGYYYPDVYLLPANASGSEVGKIMISRFNENVLSRYATSTKKIISVDTAMKIASIIEREANGKNDMRLISGIMWNRIFKDMTLDIDATLQYAKGSEKNGWWPKVNSEDKFISSPFNTYKNKGLTPTPISNPGLASIEAALNPKKTSCLFYLHDKYRRIHCAATYKEHVRNIDKYY